MRKPGGRRAALIGAAVVVVAGSCAAGLILSDQLPQEGGTGHEVAAAPTFSGAGVGQSKQFFRPDTPTPAATWIATLSSATPYSSTPGGPPVGTLPANNPFGTPEVLAVVGTPDPSGYAQVELPIRPNGSLGYISTTGVSLTETTYQVDVNLESDTLTVLNNGQAVMTVPAAVGKPSTPTPPAHTYLWELIRPDNPNGAYGPYIFGLALFSDAYSIFNGGDAQIGIHGQDEPSSVGHPVSHGCVRLANDVIDQLAGLLPLGTPVTIS